MSAKPIQYLSFCVGYRWGGGKANSGNETTLTYVIHHCTNASNCWNLVVLLLLLLFLCRDKPPAHLSSSFSSSLHWPPLCFHTLRFAQPDSNGFFFCPGLTILPSSWQVCLDRSLVNSPSTMLINYLNKQRRVFSQEVLLTHSQFQPWAVNC